MIFDYILVGLNLNSLMIGYYLNKLNNKILFIDKKSKKNHFIYYKNNTILKFPEYSNNDINFLNFLKDIDINFRLIGTKLDNIKFNLCGNFEITELITISLEFVKEFVNDYSSKNVKLIDKSKLFSEKSITYIKTLCNFYNLNYYDITLYDFTNMINNCIINEFFIINEKKLFKEIIKKYNQENLEISYKEKFINIIDKNIETNKRTIIFNNKCLFFLSPKHINFINKNDYNTFNIYNYIWNIDINIEKKYFESIKYNYIKKNNFYTIYSKNELGNDIDEELFFLGDNYIKIINKNKTFSSVHYDDNYIIINNLKNIESNIINNYLILNKILNKKNFKIYKNDSIIDIIKLLLIFNYLIK